MPSSTSEITCMFGTRVATRPARCCHPPIWHWTKSNSRQPGTRSPPSRRLTFRLLASPMGGKLDPRNRWPMRFVGRRSKRCRMHRLQPLLPATRHNNSSLFRVHQYRVLSSPKTIVEIASALPKYPTLSKSQTNNLPGGKMQTLPTTRILSSAAAGKITCLERRNPRHASQPTRQLFVLRISGPFGHGPPSSDSCST